MNKKSRATLIAIPVLGLVLLAAWYLHHTNIPVLEPKGPVGRKELDLFITGLLLSLVVVIQAAKDLRQHRRDGAGIFEVAGQPVVLGELAVAPASPAGHRAVKSLIRTSERGENRR